MLILSRREGETVMIGDEISVTVTAIGAGQVRLGIVAPRELRVDRREIYEKNRKAPATPRPTIPNR